MSRRNGEGSAGDGEEGALAEGSVLFVGMKDFMTFKDAAFRPGPGFNVVVGPNGSGKSSFVSALTLGLGGDVVTLRRQHRLSDFVNSATDARFAEVRVELAGGPGRRGRPYDIRCRIWRATEKAEFWLDGQPAPRKKVCELAESLQIQTSNLCQFLPQDVVREFPEMTPAKIFQSTVRAVGDKETLELHDELVQLRTGLRDLRQNAETKADTLNNLRRQHEDNKKVLDHITLRNQKESLMAKLEMRVKYLRVSEAKKEMIQLTDQKTKALVHLKGVQAKHEKLLQGSKAFFEKKEKLEKELAQERAKLERLGKRIDRHPTLTRIEDEVVAATQRIDGLKKSARNRGKRISAIRAKMAEARKQKAELEQGNHGAEADRLGGELRELELRRRSLLAEAAQGEAEAADCRRDNAAKAEELRHATLYETQMLKQLERCNSDSARGVAWLRSNLDMFDSPVHEPLMLSMRVKDGAHALYVESRVGRRDLETFVCEEAGDVSKLINLLRKGQKLRKINVVHSPGGARAFPRPAVPRGLEGGFVGFLADLVQCPAAVNNYLCERKRLHTIPVFTGRVDEALAQQTFSAFFIDQKFYDVRRNRFGGGSRTNIDDLSNGRVPCFVERVEEERIGGLREALRLGKERQQKLEEGRARCKGLLSKVVAEVDLKGDQLQAARERVRHGLSLEKQLRVMEKEVEALQTARDSEDVGGLEESRRLAVGKLASALEGLDLPLDEAARALLEAEKRELEVAQLEDEDARDKRELAAAKREVAEFEGKVRNLGASIARASADFKKMHGELEWEAAPSKKYSTKIPAAILKDLDESCPAALPDVRARIATVQQELDDMPVYSNAEVQHVREISAKFNSSESELRDMRKTVAELRGRSERKNTELVRRVNSLVERVNDRFSDLMAKFGNTGNVVLRGGDDQGGEDGGGGGPAAAAYGLDILVKFAKGGPVQKLAAGVQSGGEKSVVTALYMMALQEMTRVPFRCADEINQGMDDRNERAVWAQLMDTAAKYSAQYFYLAPKFPRSLRFGEDMTVITCFNGTVGGKRRAMTSVADILAAARGRKAVRND